MAPIDCKDADHLEAGLLSQTQEKSAGAQNQDAKPSQTQERTIRQRSIARRIVLASVLGWLIVFTYIARISPSFMPCMGVMHGHDEYAIENPTGESDVVDEVVPVHENEAQGVLDDEPVPAPTKNNLVKRQEEGGNATSSVDEDDTTDSSTTFVVVDPPTSETETEPETSPTDTPPESSTADPETSTTPTSEPEPEPSTSSDSDPETTPPPPTTSEPTPTETPSSTSSESSEPTSSEKTSTKDEETSSTAEPTSTEDSDDDQITSSSEVPYTRTTTLVDGAVTTITSVSWVNVVPTGEPDDAATEDPDLQGSAPQQMVGKLLPVALATLTAFFVMA